MVGTAVFRSDGVDCRLHFDMLGAALTPRVRAVSFRALVLTALMAVSTACQAVAEQPPLSASALEELSLRISESPGYFDTDNLITNEDSFQHVVPSLRGLEENGVYIGVGPDQNFTYIVHSRPVLAFIVDVRHDNLLLQLYFKALAERSETRADYLTRLLGRPLNSVSDQADDAESLVAGFDGIAADSQFFDEELKETWDYLGARLPRLMETFSREKLTRLARPFLKEGLELRFRSHGRHPHAGYPTLRRLLTETDRAGRMWGYLNSERDYRLLREMHLQNRIIPIVGDLGGSEALQNLADYLEDDGLHVSVLYVSNVEEYLFRAGTFEQYVDNLTALPIRKDALMIRSYFGRNWRHPDSASGYFVTSLVQPISRFVSTHQQRPYRHYADVLFRDVRIPAH